MINPKKLIYKYSNNNKKNQYILFIFIGPNIKPEIKKILLKIKNLSLFDTLIHINNNEFKKLEDFYGKKWFNLLFPNDHIDLTIKLIQTNNLKKKNIIKKFGLNWFNNFISKNILTNKFYSFSFLFKKENEIKERQRLNSLEKKISQIKGGGKGEGEGQEEEEEDNIISEDLNLEEYSEELNLDEIENMSNENNDIDNDINTTLNLINDAIEKKKINKILEFPIEKNEILYEDIKKNLIEKNYIFDQYIFDDDTIINIKKKISCSIKLNSIFYLNSKKNVYLLPSRIYLWSEYNFIDKKDNIKKKEKISIGHKWINRNEILNINIEPLSNIKIYENLLDKIEKIYYSMKKYGSRIKMENDNNNILLDYDNYIVNNEIQVMDIYNYIGKDYKISDNKFNNLYNTFIKLYFPMINKDNFNNIINFINNTKYEDEFKYMNQVYNTINNDLIIENEITFLINKLENNKSYDWMFQNTYITHSIIHLYLNYDNNHRTYKLDLRRIFDNFILSDKYPFIQYQLMNNKMIYKIYHIDNNVIDKEKIQLKWFKNNPYGITFKVSINNKVISIGINNIGRLQYNLQFEEKNKIEIDDIIKTYKYIIDLIKKINDENNSFKILEPTNEQFKFAFINSIQKFEITKNHNINHNYLSDFARFFFPFISVVIEPKKRQSKIKNKNKVSKYGTYLRYKRISKYDNQTKIENRIIYIMKHYEFTEVELINEVAKQFNITKNKAEDEVINIRKKYPIIKKSSKILRNISEIPKSKPPGIELKIQGKSRFNYKIRISGARNKFQLNKIKKFSNILLYLYTEIYIHKNKKYIFIKNKLSKLINIAKRRNKVFDIFLLENKQIKEVKKKTNNSSRLGFKPPKGFSHWSRYCQNSGKDKKRHPNVHTSDKLEKLLNDGYKYNSKSGFYEKKTSFNNKPLTIRAAEVINVNDNSKKIYYTCDPKNNGEHHFVGFLSKSVHPDGLCMPCCFKKDPLYSKNIGKKNYYLECNNKKKKDDTIKINNINTKIYILKNTNKIQEGKFGLLPNILDVFLNKILNLKIIIKNNYLEKTESSYLLRYGIKISKNSFINCIAVIFNLTIDQIKNKLISLLKNDKNDILFTSLNNGNIKNKYSKNEFINFIKDNNLIKDLFFDFITKKNVLTPNGLNIYIFKNKDKIIKTKLEKDKIINDFIIEKIDFENNSNFLDKTRDNIIILFENNIYYPIINIIKNKNNFKIEKIINQTNIIDNCSKFYNINNNINIIKKYRNYLNYNIKNINFILKNNYNKKYKITNQIIDINNKVRYFIINKNITIPCYPSGTIEYINIDNNINKFILSINKTLDNLLLFDKLFDNLNFKPIGLLYTKIKNNKYLVVGFIMSYNIDCSVKQEYLTNIQIKKIASSLKKKQFKLVNISNELHLNNIIINKEYILDNRIQYINKKYYEIEGYNLFKFELSNYFNKNKNLRSKIIKIIDDNKINKENKIKMLRKILFENLNKTIYNKIYKGGNNFLVINNKEKKLDNYQIINNRNICENLNKKKCIENNHCSYINNKCKFELSENYFVIFINKIIIELINKNIQYNEILNLNDCYVSDIVNNDKFIRRKNQKILRNDIYNIEFILNKLFDNNKNDNIKKKKNKKNKNLDDLTEFNPIKINNQIIQNIIINNNSVIRAYTNSIYWINNNLLDQESRNLGYNSEFQNNLSNYFRGIIIEFMNNNNILILNKYKKYLKNLSINKYIDEHINDDNITNDGIIELAILSFLYNNNIIIYNNFETIIYHIYNGNIIFDHNINKNKNYKIKLNNEMIKISYFYDDFELFEIKVIYD